MSAEVSWATPDDTVSARRYSTTAVQAKVRPRFGVPDVDAGEILLLISMAVLTQHGPSAALALKTADRYGGRCAAGPSCRAPLSTLLTMRTAADE